MITNTIYKTAIYIRLSREDEKLGESTSIQNQRKMLMSYLESNKELNLIDEYVDDGYSGTTFDRPAFKRMIEDIEEDKINCVVVKDLSRFGRDYIDGGYYLDKYFPNNNIRFIALGDNMDSLRDDGGMIIPIKNVINHYYAVDISKKVQGTFKAKQNRGEFIGAFTSYGYKKDPTDKSKLILDEYAATVVKRIFDMYNAGNGKLRIAHILNNEGILCPSEYKKSLGQNYRNSHKYANTNYWTYSTIHKVLNNQIYAGDMVQNKTFRRMKGKPQILSKDEWIIVKNTHDAIVDRDTWEITQNLLNTKTREVSFEQNLSIFRGLIKCDDCGRALTKKIVSGSFYYNCGSYVRYGKQACCSHNISENELKAIIKDDINVIIQSVKNIKAMIDEEMLLRNEKSSKKNILQEIENCEHEIEKNKNLRIDAYSDFKEGLITSKQEYMDILDIYKNKQELLTIKLNSLKEKETFCDKETSEWLKHIATHNEIQELDRDTLLEMIDEIRVTKDKRVIITYKFSDELEKLIG